MTNGLPQGQVPTGQASPQQFTGSQPQVLQVPMVPQAAPMIPGVTVVNAQSNTAPMLLVIGKEKEGKSATSICSLFGYPDPSKQPLVIAWDRTGPDSCIRLGYQPHRILVHEQNGARYWDKAKNILDNLERNVMNLSKAYGAIVVDCASTMADRLHEDARRFSKNPDPRSHFGELLLQSKEFINRVCDLGLPTVWLAWLKEAEIQQEAGNVQGAPKKFKMIPGGPNILGNTRALLAGKAHQILILEKVRMPIGTPGADEEGFVRQFHTRPWNDIQGGGRYSHVLPEPCQPSVGFVLAKITGRV